MKTTIFIMLCLFAGYTFGQDYLITFTAKGASNSIDSILVENVTQRKSITIGGTDLLRLQKTVTTDAQRFNHHDKNLRIYPNPIVEYAKVEFYSPVSGNVSIDLFDISGQQKFTMKKEMDMGINSFFLSGLEKGFYSIRIHSTAYNYSGKIVSCSEIESVEKVSINNFTNNNTTTPNFKSAEAEIRMQYNANNQLRFTAFSGNFATIISDVPSESKTIDFEFFDSKDADNNVYKVVQLGTQFWMAENLRTTTYNDKSKITIETDDVKWETLTTPAYCWYNNDKNTYGEKYGALYNWYAVNTGKLCPTGWHVPSDEEWTVLSTYLETKGFGYKGSNKDIAKSMATVWGWNNEDTEDGDVGYEPEKNNASGFSGPPAGVRGGRVGMGYYGYWAMGSRAQWWSSTEDNATAFTRHFFYYQSVLNRFYSGKSVGFPVRCVLTK
jgi:uncharacterized protein (TIGR02145 family)